MQYKVGYAAVTNGSNIVSGINTLWATKAAVGNTFKVQGENALYSIIAVGSNTQITLNVPYAGVTNAAASYVICKDYTPGLALAEINVGDVDWPYILTAQVIRKIDTYLNGLSSLGVTGTTVGATGAADNLPAKPLGYVTVTINGTNVKIPYYNT